MNTSSISLCFLFVLAILLQLETLGIRGVEIALF